MLYGTVSECIDMCGIFTCIYCSLSEPIDPTMKAQLQEKLRRRGPDHTGEATVPIGGKTFQLDMIGTLLHMRGDQPTPQPLRGNVKSVDTGDSELEDNLFLWNGNIFGGEIEVLAGENDTVKLFDVLNEKSDTSHILSSFSKIHGPWAFVYWQSCTKSLWFGRDAFGRRSLLWHLPLDISTDSFLLSSVGQYHPDKMPLGHWSEVPASGIFQLKFSADGRIGGDLLCYPWMQEGESFQAEARINEELSSLKTCFNVHRVDNAHLQVPFSPLNKTLPALDQIDSVSLDSNEVYIEKRTPFNNVPSKTGSIQDTALPRLDDGDEIATAASAMRGASLSHHVSHTLRPAVDWRTLATQLITVLERAVHSRVDRAPYLPSVTVETRGASSANLERCGTEVDTVTGAVKSHQSPVEGLVVKSKVVYGRARIAILFSGGVDSMVLAALVDRCLDSTEQIDLINVAFEQKLSPQSKESDHESNFDVPDRISSMESLKELNPRRKWNLVLVNVTLDQVNAIRKERVSHLIYPLCTVLDDSIGCAFWFAARGQGTLYDGSCSESLQASPLPVYHSQARTLFVGVGADEQLAGYSRHRTKFRASGWAGLLEEVEMDVKRLSRRNLGRDDRCIADHHREGQFPFLDEGVVTFLQQLPLHCKTDLDLPRGMGEKRLLREVAAMLGCHGASKLPKRAIQFGSRMAKLAGSSNSRELGSDICKRLLPDTS